MNGLQGSIKEAGLRMHGMYVAGQRYNAAASPLPRCATAEKASEAG